MRSKTSNRHLYMKKKGELPDAALKKEKSLLLQGWTTTFQESSRFASFTWHCIAATLTAKVREDLYFKISSLTQSYPVTIGEDDGDPTLWLRRTWGDALMSLPLVLAPLENEGERITMTGISSLAGEVAEGHVFLWRREVPPPV